MLHKLVSSRAPLLGVPRKVGSEMTDAGLMIGLIALAIGIAVAADKILDAVRYYVDNSKRKGSAR